MHKKTIMIDIIISLMLVALFFGLPFIIFSIVSKIQLSFSEKKQQEVVAAIQTYCNMIWTSDELKDYEDFIPIIQEEGVFSEIQQRVRIIAMDRTCVYDNFDSSYHSLDYYDKYPFDDSRAIKSCRWDHSIFYEEKQVSNSLTQCYYAIPLIDLKDTHVQLIPYYVLFISYPIIQTSLSKYSEGIIVITSFLLFLSVILAFILKHKIVTPIKLLSKETKLVADENGKFTKTILFGNERYDEIGDLSKSFTSVIEKVNYRINEIESLSSDLSHEIKNPLSVISNIAEIIETGDFTEEERIDFSNTIIKETKKINCIVSMIREASKIENKIYETDKETILLDNYIINFISSFKEQHSDIKIQQSLTLHDKCINSSPELLEHMFSNLLTNAASFANTILVSTYLNGNFVMLEIEDNGPGIPDSEKEKVFSRFYSKRKTEDKISHDGLGLYLVKYIVNSMKGTINIYDSKKLGGANFNISIPIV